jgi:signal transduction histidine kinase
MNTNAIILRGRSALLHCIRQSTALPASHPALDKKKNERAEYVSAIVHEVRNPITNIDLALEMLDLNNLDEEQKEYLAIIARGSRRIKDLINTLLRSGQIGEYTSEMYSLHQILEDVLTIVKDRILLKKIAICREYGATEHRVLLVKEKMKIALTNIITNAIEAMPSATGELKLVTRSMGKQSSLEIHDNGIGINKEDLKRIFDPYFTNKPGGMGLGLSTTLDILRANHARVDVRSEEGLGTRFILSFYRRE